MNRTKILALLVTVALLATLPIGLYAQAPVAPHQFFGTVTMADGSVAPDGTVVAALVGGEEVVTATVESSFEAGFYVVKVGSELGAPSFVGETVTFTVDGIATADSIAWQTLMSQELNLTAIATMMAGAPVDVFSAVIALVSDLQVWGAPTGTFQFFDASLAANHPANDLAVIGPTDGVWMFNSTDGNITAIILGRSITLLPGWNFKGL